MKLVSTCKHFFIRFSSQRFLLTGPLDIRGLGYFRSPASIGKEQTPTFKKLKAIFLPVRQVRALVATGNVQ